MILISPLIFIQEHDRWNVLQFRGVCFFKCPSGKEALFRNLKNSRLVIHSDCSGKAMFFLEDGFNLKHHAFCDLFQYKKLSR